MLYADKAAALTSQDHLAQDVLDEGRAAADLFEKVALFCGPDWNFPTRPIISPRQITISGTQIREAKEVRW
jgi:hypothetical protein